MGREYRKEKAYAFRVSTEALQVPFKETIELPTFELAVKKIATPVLFLFRFLI
jgi:hypothetical protein